MNEQDDPQTSFEAWELEENWADSQKPKMQKSKTTKKANRALNKR